MGNVEFRSVFREEFHSLVTLKQSLGFKYETDKCAFKRIDTFFVDSGLNDKVLSKELCEQWCKKRSYESDANHASRISSLRVFCKHIQSLGFPTYVPPHGITKHSPKYNAHIYTDDELRKFFNAVDNSQSVPDFCPYRSKVMPIFFRILYTSGMRVSELRLARLRDVNLEEDYILVRQGKNQKDRIVPIHPDLAEKCRELKGDIHSQSPEDEYFFMLRPGREMTLQNLYHNFRRYLEQAGISHSGRGPRIHDFRHTYCINLLQKWIQKEKDLLAYLPYMRTMLGHESFTETAYYLKLTASAFPMIRERLDMAFPALIGEVSFNDQEYY